MAWDVDKPLGLFLEDIYSEGGDHEESAEAGEIAIFKNKEGAVTEDSSRRCWSLPKTATRYQS